MSLKQRLSGWNIVGSCRTLSLVGILLGTAGCGAGICPSSSSTFTCSSSPSSTVSTGTQPDSISGLVLWLRADDLALADGAAVSSWTDRSTSSANASQGAAGAQPTYQSNQINGRAVVRFSNTATKDFMTGTLPTGYGDLAVFVAGKMSNVSSSDGVFFGFGSNDPSLLSSGGNFAVDDGSVGAFSDLSLSNGQTFLLTLWRAASVGYLASRNGSITNDSAKFVGFANTATSYSVGSSNGTLGMLDGDIAENIVYNSDLTGANRTGVLQYLNSRYSAY
jgi:hypothetical protein